MARAANMDSSAARVRQLRPADLDAVTAIDAAAVGRSRRLFFEKRLVTVQADPGRYLTLGAELDGQLVGYAIAHLGKGEFGADFSSAVVEAIGVAPGNQRAGIGEMLMRAMADAARDKGADALYSQVDWTNSALLGFFARTGFELAPRTLFERDIP
ncbi:MAG: GNAT family N-acetyltransferase [Alphaproteobacteria bacterium]